MRTLVISDLHLGARDGVDVLRRPAALERLLAALDGVDRLVVLGDALELRHGPLHDALEVARPVFGAIGDALGRDAQVVLVPGNHDHRLVAPWLEWRLRNGPAPLSLEEHAGPRASTATRAIARMVAPAGLDVAYPGLWLDEGVFAIHGHYLDRQSTIPSFERLGAGALARFLRTPADGPATPDDYEVVLAPMYAFLDAVAARVGDGRAAAPGGASLRLWRALAQRGRRPVRHRALAAAFPLAVEGLNLAGLGPLSPRLSGPDLRRASLLAMVTVVERLGIDARHVLFGHTHRGGPHPGDDRAEWTLPGGGALLNTGSWVYESAYLDGPWGNPYFPGRAIELRAGEEPRARALLDGVAPDALRAPSPGPAQG